MRAKICGRSREFGLPSSRMPASLKGDRMFSRSIFKMFLVVTILVAAVATATAAAPANEEAQSSVGSIHTYLMPDLSLKSVFFVPLAPQAEPSADPRKFKGACRCSCATNNCNTDADCGPGGVCEQFISCCAKLPEAKWFQDSGQSSRKTELPAFKAKCN